MISADGLSAFGVDHGAISKARRGPTGGRTRPDYPSMAHQGGAGYYGPSPEQVSSSKARRAAQAADKATYKAGKPDRLVGGGKKIPLRTHWKAAGDLPKATAVAALVGGGALYGVHRANVKKSDRGRETAVGAAGAVGGGALTSAGLNVGGQTAKATLKQRRATQGTSPNQRKIWDQHVQKHPIKSGKDLVDRHMSYPKSLPDWQGQRLLAFKNKPTVTAAAVAAGAGAGAAFGVHGHREKSK